MAFAEAGSDQGEAPPATTPEPSDTNPEGPGGQGVVSPEQDLVQDDAADPVPPANEASDTPEASDPEAPGEVDVPSTPEVPAPEGSAEEPVMDTAVIAFEGEHAAMMIEGKAHLRGAIEVPANQQLTFSVQADEGFAVENVTAKAAPTGAEISLVEQEGSFSIAPDFVNDGLVVMADVQELADEGLPVEETEEAAEAEELGGPLVLKKTVGGVVITLTADAGVLPEGTTMNAVELKSAATQKVAEEKAAGEDRELVAYRAFDITLSDADGNEVQPDGTVDIRFANTGFVESDTSVYHAEGAVAGAEKIAQGTEATVNHFSTFIILMSTWQDDGTNIIVTNEDSNLLGIDTIKSKNGKYVVLGTFKLDNGQWYLLLGTSQQQGNPHLSHPITYINIDGKLAFTGPIAGTEWRTSFSFTGSNNQAVTFSEAGWYYYPVPISVAPPAGKQFSVYGEAGAGGFTLDGSYAFSAEQLNIYHVFDAGPELDPMSGSGYQSGYLTIPSWTRTGWGLDTITLTVGSTTKTLTPTAAKAAYFDYDAHSGATLTFTYKKLPEYDVTYEFVSGTAGFDLPAGITNQTPASHKAYQGAEVTPPSFAGATYVDPLVGTWSFVAWDPASAEIDGAGAHFVGTWEITEFKEYPVTYDFVSWDPTDYPLPAAIEAYLPADTTAHVGAVSPAAPSQTTYADAVGTWTFQGWEPATVTIDGSTVTSAHFVGTWKVTNFDEYRVTYIFVSGSSYSLPGVITDAFLPAPSWAPVGTVNPATPSQTTYTDVVGTWTFQGWEPETVTIDGTTVTSAHFVGTWKVTSFVEYPMTYEFVSGTPEYPDLPSGVMTMLPSDSTAHVGAVVPSLTPAKGTTHDDGIIGVWEFKGWKPSSVWLDGTTVKSAHFVGTWEVVEFKEYPVTYEFVSGTQRYTALPDGVTALLPAAHTAHVGTVNPSASPAVGRQFDDGLIGVWQFRGWKPSSVEIDGTTVKSAHFVGTWEVVNYRIYTVSHVFASQKAGQALPQAVLNVCPGSYQVRYDEPVAPTYFSQQSVTVPEGTWNFVTWDPLSTRSTSNVVFTGYWALNASVFDITYVLNGGTNDPNNPTGYTYESPDINLGDPTRTGYIFDGWYTDASLETLAATPAIPTGSIGDKTFYAKWTPNTDVDYTVHYYLDGTTDSVAPDKVVDGQTFDTSVTESAVSVVGHTALAPLSQTMTLNAYGKEITFFYTINTYMVSHSFVSGTAGAALPAEVFALTPQPFAAQHTETVVPTALTQTTHRTAAGLWSFAGWDAPSKTVNADDVAFTGTWTYADDPTPPPPPPTPTPTPTPTPLPTPGPAPALAPTPAPTPEPEAIESVPAPVAEPEEIVIPDEATPLAAPDPLCWVHWAVLAGMIATLVYGLGVVVRRRRFTTALDDQEEAVLDGKRPETSAGAQRSYGGMEV